MNQLIYKPAVGGIPPGYGGNRPAVGGHVSSTSILSVRLNFKRVKDSPTGVTMKIDGVNSQLMFQVRATGVPKQMELVDANGLFVAGFGPKKGSMPSQWTAFSDGEILLTLTNARMFNKHTELDAVTMKVVEQDSSFMKPPVRGGTAYKMTGSWSGRSVNVYEGHSSTPIAQMGQGSDEDSFIVNVDPNANIVFMASLFAIANAMKSFGKTRRASLSFGMALAGQFLLGCGYAMGEYACNACAQGCCAEGCCCP